MAADLTIPGHPEVFAIGDMATLNNLPGVAEVAMQGGLHAANTIRRRLKGEEGVPFKYRDLGSVATIGRFRAVASVRSLRLSGFAGWVVGSSSISPSSPACIASPRCCDGCGR